MPQPEASLTLHAAAAGYGVPMVRLGRWCATGKLRCERHGDGWRIPVAEGATVAKLVLEDGSARARSCSRGARAQAAPNLAMRVAARLGLTAGAVTVTPLALDGVDYVVAVWRGDLPRGEDLPALDELAVELNAEFLDGEISGE